ncbi:hypothetical protein WS58_04950 [Burkholderia pseudomultivorans]|uniref:lysozyme inhibitor LprI family protein n=1 Tax=Burkholderia pseudomultivorans TaxID=1207504 RepID=UPI00075F44BE|nr:lysozyme inhibitor LprI family protein [Burkholderia pseudomultivorans]KVC51444.1 hypothetical protein WS58_04950 [Burkholderia pseudomultivorans]
MMPLSFSRTAAALSLVALGCLPVAARAASFECHAARTSIEQAICNDAELSRLDEQLDDTYRVALGVADGDAATGLRATQRAWLKARLPADGRIDVRALQQAYRQRIAELQARPGFPDAVKHGGGSTFRLTDVSKAFDFTVRMYQDCPMPKGQDSAYCEGPGRIAVYRKGAGTPLQTIDFPTIVATLLPSGKPLTQSARLYDDQGVLNVGDFNFDGHDDFGVQTGHEGGYGGPSYDVYLFDPKTGRFDRNNAMSDLTHESLGFFDVDPKRRRLRAFSKSGCCYHETTAYRVDDDRLVEVERHIEATRMDGKMEITDEELVGGKWRRKVRVEAE